jgi:hypothetical protein
MDVNSLLQLAVTGHLPAAGFSPSLNIVNCVRSAGFVALWQGNGAGARPKQNGNARI